MRNQIATVRSCQICALLVHKWRLRFRAANWVASWLAIKLKGYATLLIYTPFDGTSPRDGASALL